ncbi:hypothetical protein BC940DRAFT_282083 [Gongronella butleri]|nr:hypothetical protein BC940DRAFT_282083 [Gongronella butleri]
MSGRHQGSFARYGNTGGSYNGGSGANLNIPFPPQNSNAAAAYGGATGGTFSTTPTNTTSPYSTTSSPGYHSPSVPGGGQNAASGSGSGKHYHPPLKKYSLQPPAKLPHLSKAMPQLGYPGLFPQRPNQDEDILTEANVRTGFVDKPAVQNEQTCAHDIIYSKLQEDNRLLKEMGAFMVQVLKRKRKASRITGSTSFKPPARTALMESKKEQWIQELANSVVPLRKLARNVPHGYKGEKLLETLAAKQIPFLRATWYIKVVGLSEMTQRNASNVGSTASHAYNWTMVVTSHLKKQLTDLMPLPTNNAGTPNGMRGYRSNNVGTPSSMSDAQMKPWASTEAKARFEARWAYSTKLTRWQYSEGLLDQRNFLKWSLDTLNGLTLNGCTSLEIFWLVLTGLVQDYIDEYRRNRTLTKYLIETLIKAYSAVVQCSHQTDSSSGTVTMLSGLKRDIEHILQSLFLSSPDMFVIPKLYHQYRQLFEMIVGDQARGKMSKMMPDVLQIMETTWDLVRDRNEVFCGTVEDNQLRHLSNSGATPVNTTILADTKELEANETKSSSVKGSTASSEMQEASCVDEAHIVHGLDLVGRYVDSGYLLINTSNGGGWCDIKGHSSETCCAAVMVGCTTATGTIQTNALKRVVHTLCQWAVSDARFGDWRPFFIASILLCWRDQDSVAQRRDALQEALVAFLDESSANVMPPSVEPDWHDWPINTPTSFLYDTLIRLQLFSYHHYLNRLTARGILERSQQDQPYARRCLYQLKSLPLVHPAPGYLVNQRRVALYGPRRAPNATDQHANHANDEEKVLKQLQRLAKAWIIGTHANHAANGTTNASTTSNLDDLLNDSQNDKDLDALFGLDARDRIEPMENHTAHAFDLALSDILDTRMRQLIACATRYTLVNFSSAWLVPQVKRYVVKNIQIGEDNWRVMTSPGACLLNARQYVAIIQMLHLAQDYLSLVDVALWVLEKTNDAAVHGLVVCTLRRYASIWKLIHAGPRVAKVVWAKYKELQGRGIRDRDLMLYMVQLVQEGHVLSEDMRFQLQQDLQTKTKIRARPATSLFDELQQVIHENTSVLAVQTATEAICAAYQFQPNVYWVTYVLQAMMDVVQQWIKHATANDLYDDDANLLKSEHHHPHHQHHHHHPHDHFHSHHDDDHPHHHHHHHHHHHAHHQHQAFYLSPEHQITLQRILSAYADIIKGIANQYTVTGQLDDLIQAWLVGKPMEEMRQPQSWLALFLTLLVSRRLISLECVFFRFILPWFDEIHREMQQQTTDDDATGAGNAQTQQSSPQQGVAAGNAAGPNAGGPNASNEATDGDTEELKAALPSHLLNVCENLMILVRLLLVQERCHWLQQADGSGMYQQPWSLRAEEVFRLATLKQTQMACSLEKIEPMFALMKKLVLIASNLPLSSPLLQELVMLRADLLHIGWFRQACIRDLNGVYQLFSSHGNEGIAEKKIKRKMLTIVDELISGHASNTPSASSLASTRHRHHHSDGAKDSMVVDDGSTVVADDPNAAVNVAAVAAADLPSDAASSSLLQEPAFIDKIRRVFLNVSQWNEEQCRVQVSLLLDNILLADASSHNPNNPHILGGDDDNNAQQASPSTSSHPHPSTTGANASTNASASTSSSSGNVKSSSGPSSSSSTSGPAASNALSAAAAFATTNNKDLDAFVRFFFGVILSSQDHRRSLFYKNIIHGLREPILLALLNYGIQLLDGLPMDHYARALSTSASTGAMDMLVDHHMHHHPHHSANSNSNNRQSHHQGGTAASSAAADAAAGFPSNVLLLASLDEPFDKAHYAYKSHAFLNFMHHMLAQNKWDDTKKMDLLKTLYQQVRRFLNHLQVYQVMQDTHSSYTKALATLDLTKNNPDAAITLLTTEGITLDVPDPGISLQDLRTSLLIRLRLVIPFVSLIWEFPKADECDAQAWINVLVLLLGNPIVHGNGSQERFFEFVLDLVSLIIDEVPKEMRKLTLTLLSNLQPELTHVPLIFQSRVHRILPFSTHNIYLTPSRISSQLILGSHAAPSDPLQQQAHLEACMDQSRPWEWIEDYVSDPPHDNDTPINLAFFRARKSRRVDGTYIRCRT